MHMSNRTNANNNRGSYNSQWGSRPYRRGTYEQNYQQMPSNYEYGQSSYDNYDNSSYEQQQQSSKRYSVNRNKQQTNLIDNSCDSYKSYREPQQQFNRSETSSKVSNEQYNTQKSSTSQVSTKKLAAEPQPVNKTQLTNDQSSKKQSGHDRSKKISSSDVKTVPTSTSDVLLVNKSKNDSSNSQPVKTIQSVDTQPKSEISNSNSNTEENTTTNTPQEATTLETIQQPEPCENIDNIRQQVQTYIGERLERMKYRIELREQNILAEQTRTNIEQQQEMMARLDSSIKKIPPFIKRLRTLSEQQKDALRKDMQQLNLTRYISEVANSITEAKLKMNDVYTAVLLCSLLHQRYQDFSMTLYENWLKVLQPQAIIESASAYQQESKPSLNLSKLRVDLRFFAELITVHVLPQSLSLNYLLSLLQALVNNDKDFSNITIITSFCKMCGEDFADIVSMKMKSYVNKLNDMDKDLEQQEQISIPTSNHYTNEKKQYIRQLFKDYYKNLCDHVIQEHKSIQKMERQMKRMMENRGELNQDTRDKHEQTVQSFQKLFQNTETLADLVEEAIPELPIEEISKKSSERIGIDIYIPGKNDDDTSLWEDSDTKQFYENFPDLRLFVPGYYRDPLISTNASANITAASTTDAIDEANTPMSEDIETLDPVQIEQEIENVVLEVTTADADVEEEDAVLVDDDIVEEDLSATNMKLIMDVFINHLPTCVNRELIDKAARDFATNLNTKQNRKRLIKALFQVQRTRLDLLPFYGRLIATLNPIMSEIGTEVVRLLKNEFRQHIRKKDQIYIESKIKTVRYIGELVKFGIFPKLEVTLCLKTLLGDFRHHNIEMCCNLLETCGRYLYRSQDTHRRTEIILEILMRKKSVLTLDNRYTTMIENAYYYCNPPENREIEKKIRPPLHEYLRRILFRDLNKITIEKVLRQMRKFDWFEPTFREYAIKCLTAPYYVKYNSIHCLASILAGLAHFYDDIAIDVLDNVLDDIRSCLESNVPRYNQRRLCMVKYLGEMYNYRVVDSIIIFRTLYLLITFGVTLDNAIMSEVDPPDHLFRIRLVCTLLETCGQYFDRGTSKKKLDCFLLYFQRYFYFKKEHPQWNTNTYPFPIAVEHVFDETLITLRPKFILAGSYTKACEEVEAMEKEYVTILAQNEIKTPTTIDTKDNLPPINEEEESFGPSISPIDGDEEDENDERTPRRIEDEYEEEENDDETYNVRRSRFSGGSGERTSCGSAGDLENDQMNADDEQEDDEDNGSSLQLKAKKITSEEDDEFVKAFDTLIAESVAQRATEMTKAPAPDIAIPVHLRRNKVLSSTSLNVSNSDGDDENDPIVKNQTTMNFVVMMKKNNKLHFHNLAVPNTSEMALRLKAQEEADRQEKARLKILTLNMSTRMEQEVEQQEPMVNVLNRTPVSTNTNRTRRTRYVHQKGAPDADLIFGSKKR